ncbi:MAG TPA: serine hydrolase domain-containing protein [Candidatus Limnocylindria bacterium]|nr:serine hydrolase domain-containing protein [Candidatus Limnocylindria bacterium]
MNKNLITTLVVLLTLFGLPLTAASIPTAKPEDVGLSSERLQRVHQMIQRHIDAGDISGAVTLVARKGRVAHLEAHGLMDIESKKPMAKDTIFRLASMSKVVTGTAIMMLVEEGKIRLTDPVSKFIPEFRGQKVAVALPAGRGGAAAGGRGGGPSGAAAGDAPQFYTVPAEREITIRDLLSHVSGLGSGTLSNSDLARVARKDNENLAAYIPRLGTTALEFQPGSRWAYSPGAGFDTLGRIVEIVSGQSFDQFLRQRIFDPLGMKDIFFYADADHQPRQVTMYQRTGNGLQKQPTSPGSQVYFSGAGGLLSTAEDYLPLGQMLVNGGQLNGKRLLGPRTVEMMSSVHVPDTLPGRQRGEGFGLSVRVISDHVARATAVSTGSYGWDGAFGTHLWIDPKEQIVGILMIQTANQEVGRDFEQAVMQAVIE